MSGSALNKEVVAMVTKHDAEKQLMHKRSAMDDLTALA